MKQSNVVVLNKPVGIVNGKSFADLMKRMATGLKLWRCRRRTVRELYHLSDRQLEDIGIQRWEIKPLVDVHINQQTQGTTGSMVVKHYKMVYETESGPK